MNPDDIKARIDRAKELLKTVRHASMATVNADGTPHNSPFYLILSPDLKRVYFGSHPDSLHSQNVVRTGQMFIAIYDAVERGGLYIQAEGGHQLSGEELKKGLAVHNATRARHSKDPISLDYYEGKSPQRLYGANITKLWINCSERSSDGNLIRDYRQEISAEDLL